MSEMPPISAEQSLTSALVLAALHAWRGELQAEGAVDEEGPWIASVSQQLMSGTLSPEQAMRALRQKQCARQGYH